MQNFLRQGGRAIPKSYTYDYIYTKIKLSQNANWNFQFNQFLINPLKTKTGPEIKHF